MDSILDFLTTYITQNYTLQITDTEHSVLSLLQSPLAVFKQWLITQWTFFSFLRSSPLVTATHAEFLSTDISINWVTGWQLFHTNLLAFSSQADFQLSSHSPFSYFTSLHSSGLLTNDCSLAGVLIISEQNQQKTPPPAILLLLLWVVASQ
jgi:hypothetical protein